MAEQLIVCFVRLIRFLTISLITAQLHGRLLVRPLNQTVRVGSNVILVCKTDSATVYWYCDQGSCTKNPPNVQYIFMNNVSVSTYSGRSEILHSPVGHYDLYLIGFTKEDVGRYTCYDPVHDEKAHAFVSVFDETVTIPFEGTNDAGDINVTTHAPGSDSKAYVVHVVFGLVGLLAVTALAIILVAVLHRRRYKLKQPTIRFNEPTSGHDEDDEATPRGTADGLLDNKTHDMLSNNERKDSGIDEGCSALESQKTAGTVTQHSHQEEAPLIDSDKNGCDNRQETWTGTSHGTFVEFLQASIGDSDSEDEKFERATVCDPLVNAEIKRNTNEWRLSQRNINQSNYCLSLLVLCCITLSSSGSMPNNNNNNYYNSTFSPFDYSAFYALLTVNLLQYYGVRLRYAELN